MPIKPVFNRSPIISTRSCLLSNGFIRSSDPLLLKLYDDASVYMDFPQVWEGLFRIACIIRNTPLSEPVAECIEKALHDTEDGSFGGTVIEQIAVARAAFSVFEYSTDRRILKRIAVWLRYFEIEFDRLSIQDGFLYRTADLMEMLVRFYLATGLRSTLRLCARLRTSAFDWTTILQTFQQSIPVHQDRSPLSYDSFSSVPSEIEYDDKVRLINHAESLADGVRYSLFAGLFSGNGQDLSAGRILWRYLSRHHRAVCGGTTSDPFLCGSSSDSPIDTLAMAAWTEAFASQLLLDGSEWALNELIRIVFNALPDCLNRPAIPERQKVNTVRDQQDNPGIDTAPILYARVSRAVYAAYSRSVVLNRQGITIHYLLPGKYILLPQKQPVILTIGERDARFTAKTPFQMAVRIYQSPYDPSGLNLLREQQLSTGLISQINGKTYICFEGKWQQNDGFRLNQCDSFVFEQTHHQGVCCFQRNRLMCYPATKDHFMVALCSDIAADEANSRMTACPVVWKMRGDDPSDIPVLPERNGGNRDITLTPYFQTPERITVFPRISESCSK